MRSEDAAQQRLTVLMAEILRAEAGSLVERGWGRYQGDNTVTLRRVDSTKHLFRVFRASKKVGVASLISPLGGW